MNRKNDEADTKAGGWQTTGIKTPVQESSGSQDQIGLRADESLRRENSNSTGSAKNVDRSTSRLESGYGSMISQTSVTSNQSLVTPMASGEPWNFSSVDPAAFDYNISYKMNHQKRGTFVIVNNTKFMRETGMGDRAGSDLDAANLYKVFKKLGFDIVLKHNQTVMQMLGIMTDVARQDHSNSDCFAMAILSHGENGSLYGIDGQIKLEALADPLKGNRCPGLVGKPKLFFIQACRGEDLDDGIEMPESMDVSDAVPDVEEEKVQKIPAEADFMYAYSTSPGFFSFRNNTKGSWFVQALTKVFLEYSTKLEFNRLMTRVNREVAYKFESRSRNAAHSRKKQIPSFVSMLTKELYFVEKK